jgi:glycosyltransferase involved in cell wall biosynthesis
MPVFNEERHVSEAIESILNQTFDGFELLVVDDGSTDRTGAILRDIASQDARIRLLENRQNRGLVWSLNKAISEAHGEYVARFDGNDISHPDRLGRQVAHMKDHPEVGVLGSNIAYMDSEGNALNGGRPKDGVALSEGVIRWMLHFRCPIYHSTVMIRTSVLATTGYLYDPEFLHAEDFELWTRVARHSGISSLPEVLVKIRLHPGSVSHAHRQEQRFTTHLIILRELGLLLGEMEAEEALETLASAFSGFFRGAERDYVGASRLLLEAYRVHLNHPLTANERRFIDEDVSRRLMILGRQAATESAWEAVEILLMLSCLPARTLVRPATARGAAGVLGRMLQLKRYRPAAHGLSDGDTTDG